MKRLHNSLMSMAVAPFLAGCLLLALPAQAEDAAAPDPSASTPVEASPEATAEPAPEPEPAPEGAVAPAEPVTPAEDAPETPKHDWVHGGFETGFDAAWDDSGSDLELYQILRLRVTPPGTPKLQIHSTTWLTEDLDGDEARYSTLYSVDDTYGGAVRARVLDLYLQADDVLGGAQLRVGRQRILDGPLYNRIDGLRLRWDKPRWDAYFYAGSRASLYEDPFRDFVVGAGAGYRFLTDTRVGLDMFYGEEDRNSDEIVRRGWYGSLLGLRYPRTVETRVEDKTLGLTLHHRFNENHWLDAQFLLHDDGANEYSMDLTGLIARWDLTYLLNYRFQFDRVTDRVNNLTGYYRILGDLAQYHHVHAGVQRPINKVLTLGLEGDVHVASDEGYYNANRDYFRLATVLSAKDIGKGVGFNVALEHWNASGNDGSWTVTGELNRKWKAFDWGFGVNYEQYRYEYVDYDPWPKWLKTGAVLALPGLYPSFSPLVALNDTNKVVAREEIQTVYTRFAWKIDERQQLSSRLSFEKDDGPYAPYWQLRVSYEIEF